MGKVQRIFNTSLAALFFTVTMVCNVQAAYAVSSVSIKVSADFGAGDRLPDININENTGTYVSSSSSKYEIRDAEWVTSDSKDMTIGEEPRMKIWLSPAGDYYFKGTYRSSNVSVGGGTFVSASKSGEDLVVTIKTKPVKGTYMAPEEAYWGNSRLGEAKWSRAEKSSNTYDVYLYRGSSLVKKLEEFKSLNYNFYPYMTKAGTYYFKVRTVPSTSEQRKYGTKSEWTESEQIYVAQEDVSDGSGQDNGQPGASGQVGWIQDGSSWYFKYPDGTYQKNSWGKINDKWYLFNEDGRMLTGWQQKNGRWYYLNNGGDMFRGWLLQDNKWYYLNPTAEDVDGAMRVGWIPYNNKWYYASSNGSLLQGWNQVDGNWYYFYPGEGSKAVNTTIDGFYVDVNGVWNR